MAADFGAGRGETFIRPVFAFHRGAFLVGPAFPALSIPLGPHLELSSVISYFYVTWSQTRLPHNVADGER